jgi:hypothetical protein
MGSQFHHSKERKYHFIPLQTDPEYARKRRAHGVLDRWRSIALGYRPSTQREEMKIMAKTDAEATKPRPGTGMWGIFHLPEEPPG